MSSTTNILKSQIVTSINNLHLNGIIDKSLEKNQQGLFSSSNRGAINISTTGIYQIINTILEEVKEIKYFDRIKRRVGVNVSTETFYNTTTNRESLHKKEKDLLKVLNKAPLSTTNTEYYDLSKNTDGTIENLECKIIYTDEFKVSNFNILPNGTGPEVIIENNQNNNFISLQTPVKYNLNNERLNSEKKFVLRNTLTETSGDTGSNGKYFTNDNGIFDDCIEFLAESTADATAENLTDAINSQNEFTATQYTELKMIIVTQPNTNGFIANNTSFMFTGIQLPIDNFSSFRYSTNIANIISKSTTLHNRGCLNPNNTRINVLNVNYDDNGNPNKYSEDALFEFFSRMNFEFIKLNFNHIGKEKNHPGGYNIDNLNSPINTHHLNSVMYYTDIGSITTNMFEVKKEDFIKQLYNLKRIGNFGRIDNNISRIKDRYKFINRDLFQNYNIEEGVLINIPYSDDDNHTIGLYQLIDDFIYQITLLKNKIKKRELYYKKILEENEPIIINGLEYYELPNDKVNNIKAKTSYCQSQGGLISVLHKPSFIEIINNTDYTPGIEFKYSQDALFELLGRWLNELLKLNNGHKGFEGILPGFYNTSRNFVSQHHLNSVISQ